jgi:hypothetical protein
LKVKGVLLNAWGSVWLKPKGGMGWGRTATETALAFFLQFLSECATLQLEKNSIETDAEQRHDGNQQRSFKLLDWTIYEQEKKIKQS